jgi:hypothetical protein
MTPHARSFALRAAAKVALATAAAGCDRPEPRPVTAQTVPPGSEQPQTVTGASSGDAVTSSPSANACVVKNVEQASRAELACCNDHVAKDGDSSAGYTRFARAQTHASDAGPPVTSEARACCAALYNASERAKGDPSASANADWGARRWECCTAFIDDPKAPSMAFARCTPWGPPVPPRMDWA